MIGSSNLGNATQNDLAHRVKSSYPRKAESVPALRRQDPLLTARKLLLASDDLTHDLLRESDSRSSVSVASAHLTVLNATTLPPSDR